MIKPRLLLVGVLASGAAASCNCGAPPPPPAGALCGTGTVDGTPYGIDAEKTRMVIVVQRNDGAGCGVFHNHVVEAKTAKLEYTIDSANAAGSSFKMTVLAADLDADDPDLRTEFLTNHDPTLDGHPLSDGDRQSIRGSVADEVIAKDNPQLVFTISDLSATNGAGTAKVKADLAGATSTVDATYTVTKEGDNFTIKDAKATLDGAPYGIPRNSLGFCVNPSMELHFDLVLQKADAAPVCNLGGGDAYVPQVFGDDACAENVGYNEAREVAVRRCAGCHAKEQRLGATVPLVDWADWRTDSVRNPGKPLYETAEGYVHLDPTGGALAMPPQTDGLATPLTADELALFDGWVNDGARNTKCAADPGPTLFPHATAKQCAPTTAPLAYDSVDDNPSAAGNTPKSFFDIQCSYCHADNTATYLGVPQLSQLDGSGAVINDDSSGYGAVDFALANAPVSHGYYQGDDGTNLNFWEASVLRYLDNSMTPGGLLGEPTACADDTACADLGYSCYTPAGVCVDPAFIAFADWVQNGYPEAACP